jgi:N-acetylglucosaminyldiphosphoundecaprenol N-acetyl-beta-D-mannosaminyltransferase
MSSKPSTELQGPPRKLRRDPGPPPQGSESILGQRVDVTTYDETTEAVLDLVEASRGGMVCVSNVHMVMESFDHPAFQRMVNASDRVTPDGVPLVWVLRSLGHEDAERVYGPTLTPRLCRGAAQAGVSVGFLGGRPEVVERLRLVLAEQIPSLDIAFAHSPPFRELSVDEDRELVEAIQASGTQILFVGLGCPRQERWMALHRDRLDSVMIGVGAAFDLITGQVRQAPPLLQRAGLEWLFRLWVEPRRLWRRYLFLNPRFVYHLAREHYRRRGCSRGD